MLPESHRRQRDAMALHKETPHDAMSAGLRERVRAARLNCPALSEEQIQNQIARARGLTRREQ